MTPRDPVSGCLRIEKSLSGGGSGLLKSLKNNASFKAVSYLGGNEGQTILILNAGHH